MGTFDGVVAEGAVDEQRAFIRAFVRQTEITPETHRARLMLCGQTVAVNHP